MLRLIYLLRRKPELTREAFQQYWRDQHGPLVASFATILGIQRYVQVHSLDDPANDAMAHARGGMEAPYDGVAELWWDSEAALEHALTDPAAQAAGAALLEDESHFIDFASSPLWLAIDLPQVNPPGPEPVATPRSSWIKLMFPLRLLDSLGFEAGQRYWRTQHGPIIRSHAAAAGIARYQQVHRVIHPLEAALRESRGTVVEAYDGHAEVWLDRGYLPHSPEASASSQRAIEDESQFIDFKRSAMWFGKELVFIDRREWN